MIKNFCDTCGKEIKGTKNIYSGPCHLLEEDKRGKMGYIDSENNQISGRYVSFDLCNKCSNEVHGSAANVVYTLKKKHGVSNEC